MNQRNLPARSRGFSLVELMVAVAVSVFLLMGLFTVLQNTRSSSDNQRALSQLQDDERIAMTLFTNVIETAGYYSNALTGGTTLLTAFPTDAVFVTAGQVVVGGKNAQGDTLSLRFQADPGDANVLTCLGTNPTGTHTSTFSLDNKGNLQCSLDGADPVILVSGVKNLDILYGVGSALTMPNSAGSVDSYLTAAAMNADPNRWTNVYSIKVSLTFTNPLTLPNGTLAAGQSTPKALDAMKFSRIISIKSRTGVNVATYL